MKKIAVLAFGLLMSVASFAQTPAAPAAPQKWTLDKSHSKLTFTVTHMMLSDVDGVFKSYDASITSAKEDFSDAVFELTADLKTVSTNNEMRDGHLQKDDMFDTAKYPTMSFKSTGIKSLGNKKYALSGNLTMKGVTKPVTLNLTLVGFGTSRQGKKLAGFKAAGTIKRTDFGVGGMPDAVVSENVELTASGEFVLN